MALQDEYTPCAFTYPFEDRLEIPRELAGELLSLLSGRQCKILLYLIARDALWPEDAPAATLDLLRQLVPERELAVATDSTPYQLSCAIEDLFFHGLVRGIEVGRHNRLFGVCVQSAALAQDEQQQPDEPHISARASEDPGSLLSRLVALHGRRCLACGRTDLPLEVDHIIPRSKGGPGRIDNRQLLCGPCNRRKGTRTIDYRPSVEEKGGA